MNTLPFSEACERNKNPILDGLLQVLPARGEVLEIGSGTGQHVVHFAAALTGLSWQPSDRRENLQGLGERIRLEGSPNIGEAMELDVLESWPGRKFDAVVSSNTAHIMGWNAVCAMFAGIGVHLSRGGVFCLYGPFNSGGEYTSESNEIFDGNLRAQDPQMGIRDIEALEALAHDHHLELERKFQLPANNQLLIFRKVQDATNVQA